MKIKDGCLVSVVIPTFNNSQGLSLTLSALAQQTLPIECYEVLIVDDGSSDNTALVVEAMKLPSSFHYLRKDNGGAAAARNFGAHHSRAKYILFLDSDVIAENNLLEEHLACHHRLCRTMVVGRTHPIVKQQSDLFWQIMATELYGYDLGESEKPIEYRQLISRNLSLSSAAFAETGGFDESFPRSGFEDTEFAYRAYRQGYTITYSPTAVGVHNHDGTLLQTGDHLYNYQVSAALLILRHPELRNALPHLRDKEPVRLDQDDLRLLFRKLARQISSFSLSRQCLLSLVRICEKYYQAPALLRFLYWQVLGTYIQLGYREGLHRYG